MIKNLTLLIILLWFASACTSVKKHGELHMEMLTETFCMEHKCTSNKKHETMDIDELMEVINDTAN